MAQKITPRSANFYGMKREPDHAANGTWLEPEELCYPSGNMLRKANALFADGVCRIVRCGIADTMTTISARGRIGGQSVTGYVTFRDGSYVFVEVTPADPNARKGKS